MKSVHFFLFLLAVGCFITGHSQHTIVQLWKTNDSIPVPESVLPVPGKSELYVSLIDGKGNEKDGRGGVGILNKNGTVKNLNWVTGLNAPKGLGLYKKHLYVADLTDVVVIDVKTAKVIKTIPIPDAVFLNDITVDKNGAVYVSDTRLNKIYKIVKDQPEVYLEGATGANGLKSIGTDLYVLAGKELWKLDRNKKKTIIASGFEQGGDGIEPAGNGDFIVTCWPGIIYYVSASGNFHKMLDVQGRMNTADLGYDAATKILYVPTFNSYSVVAFELK
ncbi:SMP-30/gluconolactonase/LRE family protein [Niabella drilacis]|uniref:40-residue YVTN family beta-propeller repeat-containing protein n=1 Tax=Niabella drilacis (strain DSM 25811 / CCM 8410 / CCUG 62505 / LMG 26954 / E90) TaxID=1285928 RepID=A0A1G6UYE1_NIADE|nr:ATP-binding protein [Niabella drilacis]SDD46284.1 40-residue YVTN family beta-propeller repeat-containing protein [Niabella drilacis]